MYVLVSGAAIASPEHETPAREPASCHSEKLSASPISNCGFPRHCPKKIIMCLLAVQ